MGNRKPTRISLHTSWAYAFQEAVQYQGDLHTTVAISPIEAHSGTTRPFTLPKGCATREKNEIRALLVVLFPEFTQVFADPSRPSALTVLKAYPSAQAMREAETKLLSQFLREHCPGRYGRKTVDKLIHLAKASASAGVAREARSRSMRMLCDQLEHTQKNLELLQQEIEHLLDSDPKARSVLAISELGPTTVAVL